MTPRQLDGARSICDQILAAIIRFRNEPGQQLSPALSQAIHAATELRESVGATSDLAHVIGEANRIERCISDMPFDLRGVVGMALVQLEQLRAVSSWTSDGIAVGRFPEGLGLTAAGLRPRTVKASRRTRCATGMAVRLLPPVDRARYRQEFAAELAELPRIDQAPYAFRLVTRAWWLRRELKEKKTSASASVTTLVLATGGSIAFQVIIGWPAAILGGIAIFTLAWTISSADRTSRLATLIRSARGSESNQKG